MCCFYLSLAAAALGCAEPVKFSASGSPHDAAAAGLFDGSDGAVGSSFAAELISFAPGDSAGFGADNMPGVVLGPPAGGGAHKGGLDVVSLGNGGAIVLRLAASVIDGPGADLIVFENPFSGFVETGRVAVSEDGTTWHAWPCACDDKAAGFPGCAGTTPVHASPDNGISPFDLEKAGGDAFDLANINVQQARFVRITDTGKNEYLGETGGFDLDAVAVIHAAP